ncbi:MAG: YdcF family protein [Chitinophagales bacterium]
MKKSLWIGLAIPFLFFSFNSLQIHFYSTEYYEDYSDVAIVLGAGTNNGELSPVFRERINHGIYLLKNGKVKCLIFTGGFGKNQILSDSHCAKIYALKKGVSEHKILVEEKSTITFINLKEAKKIMKSNHLETALIVSDPYHMKRSMRMANKLNLKTKPSPTPTTMYQSWQPKFKSLMYESFYYSIGVITRQY